MGWVTWAVTGLGALLCASAVHAEALVPATAGAVNAFVFVPRVRTVGYKELRLRTTLGWQSGAVTCRDGAGRLASTVVANAVTHTVSGGVGLPYGLQVGLAQPAHLVLGHGSPPEDACVGLPARDFIGAGLGDPRLQLSWAQRLHPKVSIGAFAQLAVPVSSTVAFLIGPSPYNDLYPRTVAQLFGETWGAITLGGQAAVNNDFMEGTLFAAVVGRPASAIGSAQVGSALAYGGAFEVSMFIPGLHMVSEFQGQVGPALPGIASVATSSSWQLPLEAIAALRYSIWHVAVGAGVGVGIIGHVGTPAARAVMFLEYAPLNEMPRKKPLWRLQFPDFDLNLAAESVLAKEPVPPMRRPERKRRRRKPPADPPPLPDDYECPPQTGSTDDVLFDPRCPTLDEDKERGRAAGGGRGDGDGTGCRDGACPVAVHVQVYFDTGSAALPPRQLARIEYYLRAQPERRIRKVHITGHADAQGSDEFNEVLSRARALTVQQAVRAMVPDVPTQLSYEGNRAPVIDSEVAEAENRRVDLRIEYEEDETP